MSDDLVKRLCDFPYGVTAHNKAEAERGLRNEAATRIQELEAEVERLEEKVPAAYERGVEDASEILCDPVLHGYDDFNEALDALKSSDAICEGFHDFECDFRARQSLGDSNG